MVLGIDYKKDYIKKLFKDIFFLVRSVTFIETLLFLLYLEILRINFATFFLLATSFLESSGILIFSIPP